MNPLSLIPILILVQASFFDAQGTISDVLAPNTIKVDDKLVALDGVDSSSLSAVQSYVLMNNLRDWLIGKDVYVRGNYAYLDLHGSYNSISINDMIQADIQDIKDNLKDYVHPY